MPLRHFSLEVSECLVRLGDELGKKYILLSPDECIQLSKKIYFLCLMPATLMILIFSVLVLSPIVVKSSVGGE